MKILVVDDNLKNARMFETLLRANGHQTETAVDGIEALHKLHQGNFDMILSNILLIDKLESKACELEVVNETLSQTMAALQEKEIFLKEIHHRVKNNLQLIASLLNLQSDYIKDPRILEIFKESQNRVRSMAFIHEQLYQSKSWDRIDFVQYTKDLTKQLLNSFGVSSTNVTLTIDVQEGMGIDVDTAIPCGLIINELVNNALKYAFPKGMKGIIRVALHSSEQDLLILTISDNGTGFPKDLDFRNTESFGLQLVNSLTQQLGGTITLQRQGGTAFSISFPASKPKAPP